MLPIMTENRLPCDVAKKGLAMKSFLNALMWVYFLPGLILGAVKFGMRTLEAALAAPELPVLAQAIGMAVVQGALRMLYWVPSVYESIVVNGMEPLTWLLT